MELLLVDLCKDTVLKRPTPARTTTAGAVFDVPTFGVFESNNRPINNDSVQQVWGVRGTVHA